MTENNNWKNILSSSEKIIKTFGYSDKLMKLNIIFGVILSPFLIGLIFLFLGFFYYKKAFNYAITNQRIIASFGWLSKRYVFIDYKKITDIEIKQGIIDKLMNIGHLIINTAGSNKNELVLKWIDNPYEIQKEINKYLNH